MNALDKLIETDRNMAGYTAQKYRDLIEAAATELQVYRDIIAIAQFISLNRRNFTDKHPVVVSTAEAVMDQLAAALAKLDAQP